MAPIPVKWLQAPSSFPEKLTGPGKENKTVETRIWLRLVLISAGTPLCPYEIAYRRDRPFRGSPKGGLCTSFSMAMRSQAGRGWRLTTECDEGSGSRRCRRRLLAWALLLLIFLVGLNAGAGAEISAPAVGEHRVLQYVNSSDTSSGQTEYMLEVGEDSVVDLLLVGGGGGGSTGLQPPTHQCAAFCLALLALRALPSAQPRAHPNSPALELCPSARLCVH
jgi:H+/Cl- antiporter ClcA